MRGIHITLGLLALPAACFAQPSIRFDRDVRPILAEHCFECHGPDAAQRQADLRLDRADGEDGAYRALGGAPAIKPRSIAESAVWYRITADTDEVMPPPESGKQPLSDEDREVIRRWIEAGAPFTDFWSFLPPRMPALPEVNSQPWSRQPIDLFVLHKLKEDGLAPRPTADRRTLIRRLSLDLTGLPPTRDEIRNFLSDNSAGAYEQLVDRLLASPQYGEQMTRYWLDLVRFADTNGIHHDHYRDMTPYRDWVIRAFNQNLPYDQFVTYQVAGDLYPEPTRDQLVASGFNRLHLIIDRGTALPEESFTRNVIDRVTAVGTAFMGLTVHCAVCHDHKYDPITTREFYQLFAFFNNLDGAPETGGRQGLDFQRGLQPPYIVLASDADQEKLAIWDRQIDDLRGQFRRFERQLREGGDDAQKQESLTAARDQAKQSLDRAEAERQDFAATIPAAMVMKERAEPRPAYVLVRGAYDQLGEEVRRDTPAFLPAIVGQGGAKTRMDLARWLASADHPLTARVAVNRIWQQLFGVGIVRTSEDFGTQGDFPSHPELLDYLAVSFVQSGWDMKALIKQIVMSETYQQSSDATPDAFRRDPQNRRLARGSRFRLDAEVIRDLVLASSGLLNYDLYGKSVKPPQPAGLWEAVSMPSSYPRVYEADTGQRIYRRSVYTFWKRAMPPPQMTILDAPTREACIARRERTNTPLQALLLMNEVEYLNAARHLAHRTITDPAVSAPDRVAILYETITSQRPEADEVAQFLEMVQDLKRLYGDAPELARRLCEGIQLEEAVSPAELAAWTILTSTIYNLDITKTRS